MIRVFIGYDRRVGIAYDVLAHSIMRTSSKPISITPLNIDNLGGLMWRERNPLQSTEFSFSRFLVPYLCDFSGWALFVDNDMLFRDDIAALWGLRDDRYAVQVVKHEHTPKEGYKFLGAVQTAYEKKNWSSVMLFNCARCKALTPEYVNTASGLDLHQFKWLSGDHEIGSLPSRWNVLVGYEPVPKDAANLHYTIGGPYYRDYAGCCMAWEWVSEYVHMITTMEGQYSPIDTGQTNS